MLEQYNPTLDSLFFTEALQRNIVNNEQKKHSEILSIIYPELEKFLKATLAVEIKNTFVFVKEVSFFIPSSSSTKLSYLNYLGDKLHLIIVIHDEYVNDINKKLVYDFIHKEAEKHNPNLFNFTTWCIEDTKGNMY